MPEVNFRIRWPDGREESCYSPSTVIREFLAAGESYQVAEFLERGLSGLNQAALRVEAKFGFRCSSADDQAARISQSAKQYRPEEIVRCLSMT